MSLPYCHSACLKNALESPRVLVKNPSSEHHPRHSKSDSMGAAFLTGCQVQPENHCFNLRTPIPWDVIKQGPFRNTQNRDRQLPPLHSGMGLSGVKNTGKNETNKRSEMKKVWRSILELRWEVNKATTHSSRLVLAYFPQSGVACRIIRS